MKNYRILDIYKTKLLNIIILSLISYHFHYSIIICRLYVCKFYKTELFRIYFFSEKFWYENIWNLKYNLFQKDGLIIFFSFCLFVCLFVCFFLFRFLKFLFQYFNSIKNLPEMKHSIKNKVLRDPLKYYWPSLSLGGFH